MPELGSEEIREMSLYSYRIVYEIKEPDIFVLGVIHRRPDLQAEEVHR